MRETCPEPATPQEGGPGVESVVPRRAEAVARQARFLGAIALLSLVEVSS